MVSTWPDIIPPVYLKSRPALPWLGPRAMGMGGRAGDIQTNNGRGGGAAPQVGVIGWGTGEVPQGSRAGKGAGWVRWTEGAGVVLGGGLVVEDGRDGVLILRGRLDRSIHAMEALGDGARAVKGLHDAVLALDALGAADHALECLHAALFALRDLLSSWQ